MRGGGSGSGTQLSLGSKAAVAQQSGRRYAYVLTPKGITKRAELTKRFLVRKLAEYEALKTEIEDGRGDLSESELTEVRAELKSQT